MIMILQIVLYMYLYYIESWWPVSYPADVVSVTTLLGRQLLSEGVSLTISGIFLCKCLI